MSRRKPRPLDRDKQDYRDDRLYIVACDDTYAPKDYFAALVPRLHRLQIHVVETQDGTSSAGHVLERLLGYKIGERDERWMLLDTDHYTKREHLKSFTRAIKEAKEVNVRIALSKPCFEFWLLLHHLTRQKLSSHKLSNARDVEKLLKQTLGTYNKRKLKPENFSLEKVPQAIRESREIDKSVGGGDIPDANTSRVYQLWESIISNALPAQLRNELPELAELITSHPPASPRTPRA